VWLESGFDENSTLHSLFKCLRLVVESSTLFLVTMEPTQQIPNNNGRSEFLVILMYY
jgi:hypothetical protein